MIYNSATLRFILGPNLLVDPPKSARFILFRVGTPRSGLHATVIQMDWLVDGAAMWRYRRILSVLFSGCLRPTGGWRVAVIGLFRSATASKPASIGVWQGGCSRNVLLDIVQCISEGVDAEQERLDTAAPFTLAAQSTQ